MLRVVDPHIHLWDLRTGLYPHFEVPDAGGTNAAICRNYLLAEYLEEGGGEIEVVGAVHVEAFPTVPQQEAEMIQAVADASRLPVVMVANADLRSPELSNALDALDQLPVFRGIRQIINGGSVGQSLGLEDDPDFLDGLRELGRRELSFDLQLWPSQMEKAAQLAAAAPQTMFVVNHAGLWTEPTRSGWRQWRSGLRFLSAQDNVKVKISGLGMFDADWSPQGIAPVVIECLEAFGSRRTMFASNFPVDKLNACFAAIWQAFDRITSDLSVAERDRLFRFNAIETYRIPGAASL